MSPQQIFDNFLRLLQVLRPRFYNKITWFVVAAGVALISTNLVDRLIELFLEKSFSVKITDGNDALVGLALVGMGLVYHFFAHLLDWHAEQSVGKDTRDRERNHDIQLFRELDNRLDEQRYKDILDWIGTDHSYESHQIALIDDFLNRAAQHGASFLNADVEDARIRMLNDMLALRRFLSYNFFVYPKDQDAIRRFCLYPELNMDRGGDPSPEQQDKYDKKAKEMFKLIDQAYGSYLEYREYIKRRLHV